MVSVTHQWSRRRHHPPPPPRGEWPALTSVTHRDDAVDSGPCYCIGLHQNNKSHLRLIRGSMILDHIRTRFLGGDLYARATYTRVYTVGK